MHPRLCTQGCAPKAVRACSQALVAELGLVKQAVKVPLVEVLALVKEVHEGVSTVNQELALCPVADLEDDLASEAASRASEEVEAALLDRLAEPPDNSRTQDPEIFSKFWQILSNFQKFANFRTLHSRLYEQLR